MDKWFKDILPDKDPYHNRGRDQMRKKGGLDFKCLWLKYVIKDYYSSVYRLENILVWSFQDFVFL
jgi:hypothetical protein